MIRSNLSTRPFYNERLVRLWLLLVGVLVIAATAFNVGRVIRYSRSDTQLATAASHDEARAADLRREAVRLRATVDPHQVDIASDQARMANELIDRRTFSWTDLFNKLEATLPDDVRLVSVRPVYDKDRGFTVSLNIVAKREDDVNQFMNNLEKAGSFTGMLARQDRVNEQGLVDAMVETVYTPGGRRVPARRGTRR
ncbi:MAG TPA: PilN domain-containing protein [Vicinamibacterales bacterium]|jgi:Tfp pilus assembly protein PilN